MLRSFLRFSHFCIGHIADLCPGFAQSLGVILLFFLFQVLLMIPSVLLRRLSFPRWADWALLLSQLGSLVLTLKLCLPKGRQSWAVAFPSRAVAPSVWPLILLTTAGLILVINGLDAWVSHLLPPPAAFLQAGREMGWPAVVLGAPLTEEPLLRGLILGGFTLRYGARNAILYSALLFGFTHLNPWQLPAAVLIGLVAGWLTLRTGSLWPAVLAHALNNLTSSLSRAWQIPYLSDTRFQPPWMWGLGLLLLGAGLAALARVTRRAAPEVAAWAGGL